jgi:putative glutamine amidotransferase
MNLARGGTLLADVPSHRITLGEFGDHDVRLRAGSLAARAAGETLHGSKSHHHQAIDRVGEGFEVTGWASVDDLPEAIEDPSRRFALGVQWHPEADPVGAEIAALVEEARTVMR